MSDDLGPPRPDENEEEEVEEEEAERVLASAGYLPPDPDEPPPPPDLWRVVGDLRPWGTVLLVLGWGVVFGLLALRGEVRDPAAHLARGASVTQRDVLDAAWRLLASTFLHAGPGHLFFNAATMLVVGPAVERIFTRPGFWIAVAAGGAAASLASLLWRLERLGVGLHLSVGASGAIFALGGMLLAGAFRLRRRLPLGRARALGAAILFLILPALGAGFERIGTDNAAHLGGLVAGLGLGLALPLNQRLTGDPPAPLVGGLGVLAALALAASFIRVLRGF